MDCNILLPPKIKTQNEEYIYQMTETPHILCGLILFSRFTFMKEFFKFEIELKIITHIKLHFS
ncbi:hypothetical protein HanIR_Chr11g0557521 [Helianthus annuus]|nr:hypothetical protein HanIR_Chr11g0557521 [Helianthus annuus]